MNAILHEPIAEPKVKITVEGGVVIDVESEIALSGLCTITPENR